MAVIYVPNPPPLSDFVLAVGEDAAYDDPRHAAWSRSIPGVVVSPVGGCLLIRPEGTAPEAHADGPVHFSGIAFREGRLVSRAEAGEFRWGPEAYGGRYTVIAESGDGLTVNCDEFGIGVIYVYRSGDAGPTLVSDNLHFLVSVCGHRGLALHLHEGAMLKRLIPYKLGQQPSGKHVFFDEIEILSVGRYIRVADGRLHEEDMPRRTFGSYSEALDAGLTAMREQVRAVASHASHPVLRLSGGYDSRAVFGALVREDLLGRTWVWTFPRLKADFRCAKALVNAYGGEFAEDFPWLRNTEAMSLQDAYHAWASRNFGLYSNDWGVETHRRLSFDRKTVLILNGGGGECFRDFYFKVPNIDTRGSLAREVRRLTRANGFPSLRTGVGRQVADVFLNDLKSMPGDTVKDRLRAHYLQFRNRFHFGFTTNSMANRLNFSPLMQSPFVDAARFLSEASEDPRKFVSDILTALETGLLSFPFDKDEKDAILPDTPETRERREGLSEAADIYDPVSIVFRNKSRFSGPDREGRLRAELQRATEAIADSRLYRDLDFPEYVKDIEERTRKNASTYNLYRHSVINTANILSHAT